MFVTRRRAGESILIGDGIEVRVMEIGPNKVKLGITAPKEVPLHRKELKITRDQNLAAAQGFSPQTLSAVTAKFGAGPKPPQQNSNPSAGGAPT
jgi:carbon storage regulator